MSAEYYAVCIKHRHSVIVCERVGGMQQYKNMPVLYEGKHGKHFLSWYAGPAFFVTHAECPIEVLGVNQYKAAWFFQSLTEWTEENTQRLLREDSF